MPPVSEMRERPHLGTALDMSDQENSIHKFLMWDRQDPARSSWVSPKYKYFYVGLGKIASTRIKLSLHILEGFPVPAQPFSWLHTRNLEGANFVPSLDDFSREMAGRILSNPDWYRFCFVRNPYTRLLSIYQSYCWLPTTLITPPYRTTRRDVQERQAGTSYAEREGTVDFRAFVRYLEHAENLKTHYLWCPMYAGFRPELVPYDFVGYFENFGPDFKQVLRHLRVEESQLNSFLSPVNASRVRKRPLAAFYDQALADRVYTIYREDFEYYGYRKNSWRHL